MDWLIKAIKENKYEYKLSETNQHFGTVCMPTGLGKSGVMIEDTINQIKTNKKNIIINLSCPILKLTQQLINDLLDVMDGLEIDSDDIHFYINSSDDSDNYDKLEELKISAERFTNFEKSKKSRINIVASCHKSLWRFIAKSEELKKDFSLYSYLDEAHELSLLTDSEDEDYTRIDLDTLCSNSDSVVAFSATPNPDVTHKLIEYEKNPPKVKKFSKEDSFMIYVNPRKAIQKNFILPPFTSFMLTEEDSLQVDDLCLIMEHAKKRNPNIKHKILVTLFTADQLKDMRSKLEKKGFVVYSTCSQYGFGSGKDEDPEYANIKGFVDAITNEENDCFILHIKQLISGIDIKCLTDCVLFSKDHGKQEKYRTIIQTIGRVLRPLKGERGKSIEKRIKKDGGVYFLSAGADANKIISNARKLINDYYGFGDASFEKATGHDYDGIPKDIDYLKDIFIKDGIDDELEDREICTLLMKVSDDISKKFGRYLRLKSLHVKETYRTIKDNIDKCYLLPGEYNSVEWLTNKNITKFLYDNIPKIIEKNFKYFDYGLWQKVVNNFCEVS